MTAPLSSFALLPAPHYFAYLHQLELHSKNCTICMKENSWEPKISHEKKMGEGKLRYKYGVHKDAMAYPLQGCSTACPRPRQEKIRLARQAR